MQKVIVISTLKEAFIKESYTHSSLNEEVYRLVDVNGNDVYHHYTTYFRRNELIFELK